MTIDEQKKLLRPQFRVLRESIPATQKRLWDEQIAAQIEALCVYRDCETLLCYVPLAGEIDTTILLEHAWSSGKQVAVPYCVPGTRILEFYRISSLDALVEGAFGVREPVPTAEALLQSYDGALCVTPGLAYDREGYRLGYGGGYYDRFLAGPFAGHPSVGACYGTCLVQTMLRDRFDVPCDVVVTQDGRIK